MSWGDWQEFGPPIRVADGVQLRDARFGSSWWARRWIEVLTSFGMEERLARGRSYARRGQVVSMDWKKGGVKAKVQGSQPSPYSVRITVRQFDDSQWKAALDALADQAIFAAKLLAGEMPEDIEDAFAAADATLLPSGRHDIETSCTCPDWGDPCKHVAAVYYLMGDQLDADPFRMFLLRGLDRTSVLNGIRARRKDWASGKSGPKRERSAAVESAPPLENLIESYFSGTVTDIHPAVTPEVDAPVLRRLGPPPGGTDAAIKAVLRQASEWAVRRVTG
jgi:uncharacterized Zn finger protein